jgi:FemAB-related protein (PEP-CTERM system-associated)
MNVRVAESKDIPEVDRFIENCEASSLYHDYRWVNVVEKCFGHKCFYLVCEDPDKRIVGALPMVHLKSMLFGNFLVSMPYFNYGGVCSSVSSAQTALVGEAVRTAMSLGASHIEFRQELPMDNGFPVKTSKVSMRLPLPESDADLWKSLPSKLRSQVRRPQKEGMTVRISRHDELDNFYKVFSINMRELGTPVYPRHFFRDILDRFPLQSWICTVSAGEIPVASGFLIGFKERMEIPWASSIREYNRLGPNMLLYWSCLEFSCRRGFRSFDFGRSTAGGGTYRFKEQWGASPHPMHWHYWMNGGKPLPELNPGNPKFRFAIALWRRLPLPVTRRLGPLIVKNLP